jgi:hypothetical protein
MPGIGGWKNGDPWIICDRCGFKTRRSESRKTWNGLVVCKEDYEPRHPQDFVRGRRDKQAFKDSRPEQADSFLSDNQVSSEDL